MHTWLLVFYSKEDKLVVSCECSSVLLAVPCDSVLGLFVLPKDKGTFWTSALGSRLMVLALYSHLPINKVTLCINKLSHNEQK